MLTRANITNRVPEQMFLHRFLCFKGKLVSEIVIIRVSVFATKTNQQVHPDRLSGSVEKYLSISVSIYLSICQSIYLSGYLYI